MKARFAWVVAAPLALALVACSDQGGGGEAPATPDSTPDGQGQEQETDENYPERPVEWIVPFAAGGGADASFRVFQKYADPLADTNMVVQNIDGAGGVTGWSQVMSGTADGYTLTNATPPFNVIPKVVNPDETPYELEDFQYICTFASAANVLYMHPDEDRFTDLVSFVEYAKENPGAITVGTSGAVGTDTVHMHLLEAEAGIELTPVPFDSGADVTAALAGGQIDVSMSDTSYTLTAADQITPIALAAEERDPNLPDVSTYVEEGYDIIGVRLRTLAGPPGTPENVITYWEDICREATEDPDFQEESGNLGQPVDFMDRDETKAAVDRMITDVQTVVEEHGMGQ